MNRASFIASTGAATAAAFLKKVALADTAGGPVVITPLLETVLPFGTAGFPDVPARQVAGRIESLYHLAESPTFVGSLRAFMRPSEFVTPSATLYAAERSMVPNMDSQVLAATDMRAYRLARLPNADEFSSLSDHDRATYLRLWSRSAFNTRRRFYQSVRFVIFAAFYSLPEVWSSIGYDGPLLEDKHA